MCTRIYSPNCISVHLVFPVQCQSPIESWRVSLPQDLDRKEENIRAVMTECLEARLSLLDEQVSCHLPRNLFCFKNPNLITTINCNENEISFVV